MHARLLCRKNTIVAAASFFFLSFFIQPVYATSQTRVALTISSGILTITTPERISFGSTASQRTLQQVQGLIAPIVVSDYRGTAEGWEVRVSASHLGIKGEYVKKTKINTGPNSSSSVSDLAVTGVYDGMNAVSQSNSGQGEFSLQIVDTAGSPPRPTKVLVTKPDQTSVQLDASNHTASLNGLTINFRAGGGSYASGDKFVLTVDALPYTDLLLAPENFEREGTGPSPDQSLVLLTRGKPQGTNASSIAKPEVNAQWTAGLGTTKFKSRVTWEIHPSPLPGEYQAVLLYTLL